MNVFFDTNILLDVLQVRMPYYVASAEVWTLCEQGIITGYVSTITFNNAHYILRKRTTKKDALNSLKLLQSVFNSVPFDAQLLSQAISAGFGDFEDAIQYHSALRAQAAYLLTRNVADFPTNGIPVVTPAEFLAIFKGPI